MKLGLLVLSLATMMIAGSPAARANDDPASKEALALYEEGLSLADQAKIDHDTNKYETALRKFLAAYALVRRPNILFSVAVTEKNLGRAADAQRDFRLFVGEREAESRQVEQAKKFIAELSSQVGALSLDAPPGAETAGQTTKPELEFPAAASASANPATSPPQVLRPPGEPSTEIHPQKIRNLVVLGVGGLALASFGLGAAYFFAVQSDQSRWRGASQRLGTDAAAAGTLARSACSVNPTWSDCAAVNDALQRWNNDATLSTGFYVAAGALGAASVAAFFLWPRPRKDGAAVWMAQGMSASAGRLVLEGTF